MTANEPTHTWLLRWVSIAAGVVFTATAEYQLARELGASEPVAVMLPLAIDAYVIAALHVFRAFDIALSLGLMGTAQIAAHLLDAGVMPVNAWVVVVVSLLVPVSIWRTHALARPTPVRPSVAPVAEPPAVTVARADVRPVLRVPEQVPHWETAKPVKGALPAPPDTEADTAREPSAVDFLAVRHRVRPDQIRTIADLLADTPSLTGTAAAKALVVSDRQGRRVLAAARELTEVRP